jgi:hypothetical protein
MFNCVIRNFGFLYCLYLYSEIFNVFLFLSSYIYSKPSLYNLTSRTERTQYVYDYMQHNTSDGRDKSMPVGIDVHAMAARAIGH